MTQSLEPLVPLLYDPNRSPMSKTSQRPKRRIPAWRTVLGVGILAFVLTLLYQVQTGRIRTFEITSNSMWPTLVEGEKLLMVEPSEFRVGDIVVFSRPQAPQTPIIKRLVARGPARVEMRGSRLYIDGKRNDPPQGAVDDLNPIKDRIWQLKDNEYFLVGDNRRGSLDSREYGPIPRSSLMGILVEKNTP